MKHIPCRFCGKELTPRINSSGTIEQDNILYRCCSCRISTPGVPETTIQPSRYGLNYYKDKLIKIFFNIDDYNIQYRPFTNQTCIGIYYWGGENFNLGYKDILRIDGDAFEGIPNDRLESRLKILLTFQ